MKYEVIKEKRVSEGEVEYVYLVEPKNVFVKWIFAIFLWTEDSLHFKKEDAKLEAKLKSEGKWNKKVWRRALT